MDQNRINVEAEMSEESDRRLTIEIPTEIQAGGDDVCQCRECCTVIVGGRPGPCPGPVGKMF
jgi:hypothetical protein